MAGHAVDDNARLAQKCPDSDKQDPWGCDVDAVKATLQLWQPRASRILGQEDGREITENLVGFFRVLAEWDAKERSSESADDNNGASELSPREAHGP